MAQKISWTAPEQDTITLVEINKSTTLYGTYSVVTTINATSDGLAKTANNTWVTTYTEIAGTRTDWYKIRFYDGTAEIYSEYSDPVTSEELVRLCSLHDVKAAVDTIGRWTDDEIFDVITEVDENIYAEMGTPIKAIYSDVSFNNVTGTTYRDFYVGEQNIYRVDRLFVGTTTKTELFTDDGFKSNLRYGMVRILPYASSGFTFDRSQEVEIQFVPKIYNRLATYRAAKMLLEQIDTISGGISSKELEVVNNRLENVEQILMSRVGLMLSSDYANYNSVYGVNRKKMIQDNDRNIYFGNYGW